MECNHRRILLQIYSPEERKHNKGQIAQACCFECGHVIPLYYGATVGISAGPPLEAITFLCPREPDQELRRVQSGETRTVDALQWVAEFNRKLAADQREVRGLAAEVRAGSEYQEKPEIPQCMTRGEAIATGTPPHLLEPPTPLERFVNFFRYGWR